MAGIYPIPVGRSSDALLTRRMMFQLQSEQKRLLHVEQQVVTGRRFQLPSEDAPAANRAVSLQRILEGKRQQQTNLSATQSYLDATDTALGGVADVIANCARTGRAGSRYDHQRHRTQGHGPGNSRHGQSVTGRGQPAVPREILVCRIGIGGATV